MTSAAEKFFALAHPEPNSGCWLWRGVVDRKGYGRIKVDGRRVSATRIALAMIGIEVPKNMLVCHRCDVPGCVNPEHLFVGTPADNTADMLAKKRHRTVAMHGVKNGKAKLTKADADAIRRSDLSAHEIAGQYGISASRVYEIRQGEGYRL